MTIKLLLLFTLLVGLSTNSEINQTKLNGLQSKHVFNLFKEQKLGLVFEFRQDTQTTGTLFQLKHAHRVALSLVSEKADSTTKFTIQIGADMFQTDSIELSQETGDDDFHRLSLQLLNGRFQLVVDCVQVASGEFELRKLNDSPHKKSSVHIGYGSQSDSTFPGQIRQFTVDLADASNLRCNEVKISPHIRVHRSSLASFGGDDESGIDGGNQLGQVVESQGAIQDPSSLVPQSNNAELDQRLHFVERQFQTLREFIQSMDNRLKSVELHQRGCVLNGKRVLSFGEKQQNLKECAECQCSVSGQLHCGPIGCAHLKCQHPIKAVGECCPHCGKQCYYNGVHYEHGMDIWPKQCVRCRCDDGRMECKFHKPEHCPQLACQHQQTPPNQCCPVCVNIDYCSSQANPCHSNANCENRQYGAHCTCKQGFFGNGTTCYDIDECLWDESARSQLGGCQAGTICINLPGSFKCDCLPGFQRLDERNCLDLIRI